MIYETVDATHAASWIVEKQKGLPEPPSAWELESPEKAFERVQSAFADVGPILEFRSESGAIDLRWDHLRQYDPFAEVPERDPMMQLTFAVATFVDEERSFYRWIDLDDEERGAPSDVRRAVSDEYWAGVGDVRQVGPGGRFTFYESHARSSIMIRRRVKALGGAWRPVTGIMETVNDMLGQEPAPDGRLRSAFGYFEASKLERQRYLRPVFVFVWDRPAAEHGPRWRVASVVAATTLGDLPLTAGLESAAGGCP